MSIPNGTQRAREFEDELNYLADHDAQIDANIALMLNAATTYHELGDEFEANEFFKTAEAMIAATILDHTGHLADGVKFLMANLEENAR